MNKPSPFSAAHPPKLLWASPFAPHDPTSPAARSQKLMLEKLRKRGVRVVALGALIFENPSGIGVFPNLEAQLKDGKKIFDLKDHDIEYFYVRTASTAAGAHTDEEQRLFFQAYCDLLRKLRPDVIMCGGGDMLSLTIRAEAARRGVPAVCPMRGGEFRVARHLHDASLVLVDTATAAAAYARAASVNAEPIGLFLDPEAVVAAKRKPRHVLLPAAAPERGFAPLIRLALMAGKEIPDLRFLVIQEDEAFAAALAALHGPDGAPAGLAPSAVPNVDRARNVSAMRDAWALARITALPVLRFDDSARFAAESVMNGIPVLGSSLAAIPEAAGDGGIFLEPPAAWLSDHLRLPTEEETRPWLDALKKLLAENRVAACAAAAKKHDVERRADELLDLLTPLFLRRAGSSPMFLRSGISTS